MEAVSVDIGQEPEAAGLLRRAAAERRVVTLTYTSLGSGETTVPPVLPLLEATGGPSLATAAWGWEAVVRAEWTAWEQREHSPPTLSVLLRHPAR